jgi:hypothetical protein
MDYAYLIRALKDEARQNIQFARMNKFPRFLARVITLPWLISTMCAVLSYYVTLFFYKACLTPIQHLHNIMRKEGENVKHGTQVVIYWIAFPVIFELYILLSLATVSFYFQWFQIQINMYFATLGGIKWQPFITDATFEERAWIIKPSDKAANTWGILGFFGLPIAAVPSAVVGLVFGLIASVIGSAMELEGLFAAGFAIGFILIFALAALIYSIFVGLAPIVFFKKEEATEAFEEFEELAE